MLTCNTALRICCFKVSLIGGIFSINRALCVNSIRGALFMSSVSFCTIKNGEELFNELLVLLCYFGTYSNLA